MLPMKLEIIRSGKPELCEVMVGDETYCIARGDDMQPFIAKCRLGAWSQLTLSEIVLALRLCDKLRHDACAEVTRLGQKMEG